MRLQVDYSSGSEVQMTLQVPSIRLLSLDLFRGLAVAMIAFLAFSNKI